MSALVGAIERERALVYNWIPVRELVRIMVDDYEQRRVWEYGLQTPAATIALRYYAPLIGYRSFSCYFLSDWNGRPIKAFAVTVSRGDENILPTDYTPSELEKGREAKLSGTSGLDGDLVCDNLTMAPGSTLITNGYRVIVRARGAINFNGGTITNRLDLRLYIHFVGEKSARFYDGFDPQQHHDLLKSILLRDLGRKMDFSALEARHLAGDAWCLMPPPPARVSLRRDWTREDCYWCGSPAISRRPSGRRCDEETTIVRTCERCSFASEYQQ